RRPQLAPERLAIAFRSQCLSVEADRPLHGLRFVVDELDPQVSRTMLEEPRQVLGRRLGYGVEEGVPATHIGLEWVLDPDSIAQLDVVAVARPAAVGRVRAGREEGAIDAVLHVEHWNLLMDHHLEPG